MAIKMNIINRILASVRNNSFSPEGLDLIESLISKHEKALGDDKIRAWSRTIEGHAISSLTELLRFHGSQLKALGCPDMSLKFPILCN